MKIRTGIAAVAIGALSVGTAVPAHASTADADACRIMGPAYVDGVKECVCLVMALITPTPLPDVEVCSR